jgi:hypothetical protein
VLKWLLLFCSAIGATPDLIAPFTVDLIRKGSFIDSIEVTTYLVNNGTSVAAPTYPNFLLDVSIGIDSFQVRSHSTLFLTTGNVLIYKDTIATIAGPFSITTWCDPLHAWGEGGGELVNNVRSQAYNFHPTILLLHDTTVVYDTLRFHDTLKVVEKDTVKINLHDTTRVTLRDTIFQRDTIRVVIRDTVIKRDTIRVGPPTLAKAASLAYQKPVASIVYDAVGVKVWEGMLQPGGYPPAGLRPGLHLIVQGDKARRFRIAYR